MNIAAQPAESRPPAGASGTDEPPRQPASDAGFDSLLGALAQALPIAPGLRPDFALRAAGNALPEPGGLAKELAARQAARTRPDPVAEPTATKPIVEAAQDELRSASERAIGRDASGRLAGERAPSPGDRDRAASAPDSRSNADHGTERGLLEKRNAPNQPIATERTDHARQAANSPGSTASGLGNAPFQETASGSAARVQPQPIGASPAQAAATPGATKGGDAGSFRSLMAIGTTLDRASARAAATTARSNPSAHPSQDTAEAFRAQVARGLAAALRRGDGRVVLRLHPESLGMVRVSMGVRDGVVTAQLEPTTRAARELLESGLSSLRAALEARGLHVDRLIVQPTAQHTPDGKAEPSSGDGGESDRAGGDGAPGTGPEGHGRSDPRDAGAEVGAGAAPATDRAATDGAPSGWPSWMDGSAEIVVTADGAAVPIRIDLVA
ncbi:MAG TPA: flagellar hook-length control protein FliK [Phycisphaerales bacterium]|nr:flagellar hook-length control protein FliK [Phycisphaerales bacterium]